MSVTFFHVIRHGGTEHHDLFIVRSLDKNILNVSSHFCIAEHFVALVDNEELTLSKIYLTFSKLMSFL